MEKVIGLKIDVDTLTGTQVGVQSLLETLKQHKIKATFFVSVGPDNMGRHLWRLFNPFFALKMLRSKAAKLYGFEILARGTFFPGPSIGKRCSTVFESIVKEEHEIGLHAWDHHAWQMWTDTNKGPLFKKQLSLGVDYLENLLGFKIQASASPGWKCTDYTLKEKNNFHFSYNSDCRGSFAFYPTLASGEQGQLQIPTTLPTYDEVIGSNGVTDENYNELILSLLKPNELNVLTVHAEVEGQSKAELFNDFLNKAQQLGYSFVPLKNIQSSESEAKAGIIIQSKIKGRAGSLAVQSI